MLSKTAWISCAAPIFRSAIHSMQMATKVDKSALNAKIFAYLYTKKDNNQVLHLSKRMQSKQLNVFLFLQKKRRQV
jgi:hypothetical protein